MIDLSGRIVIVTGGNSGIGLGIAPGVARAGASVAIWSRCAERNAEAVAELEGLGATAIGAQCDVSNEDNVAAAMRETPDRYGRLDCLVANAGTTGKQPFTDMTLGEWHRVLHVNLDGTFLCLREAARGRSRISAAMTARSAQSRRGLGLVRRSTATSCRRTSSSAFLDADERPSKTRPPQSRTKIR